MIRNRASLTNVALMAGCLFLAACGGAPAASQASSGSAAASRPVQSVVSSAQAAAAGASGAYTPAADWQSKWDALVAAAKKEGKIVLAVAPGGGATARQVIPPAFKQDFGIDVEVLVNPSEQMVTRLKLEQSSGLHTVDAVIGGGDTMYTSFYGDQLIAPMRPLLIHPEALDPARWSVGRPWFMDPEQQYVLRIANSLTAFNVVNTNFVKPTEFSTWNDMLKPQYKGKITVFDPTINGSGAQTATYLYLKFGGDFIKKLYVDQQPAKTQDTRQFADWVGRGNYPIAVSLNNVSIDQLKKDGLPIELLPQFPEALPYLTGGSGLMAQLKDPPHPTASALFMNWMAMDRGQTVYDQTLVELSPRTTVKNDWAPDYIVPKPGINYVDTYDWDYVLKTYPEAFKQVRQILAAG